MSKAKLHSFYYPVENRVYTDYDGTIVNPWTGEVTTPPSMTKQSFLEECDIKNILSDYNSTGQIRHLNPRAAEAQYADLPVAQDFQTAMNIVLDADRAFADLPSSVRNRFNNSPALFLEFIHNPANQDEMIKMGLAKDTRPPPEPSKAPESPPPEA